MQTIPEYFQNGMQCIFMTGWYSCNQDAPGKGSWLALTKQNVLVTLKTRGRVRDLSANNDMIQLPYVNWLGDDAMFDESDNFLNI